MASLRYHVPTWRPSAVPATARPDAPFGEEDGDRVPLHRSMQVGFDGGADVADPAQTEDSSSSSESEAEAEAGFQEEEEEGRGGGAPYPYAGRETETKGAYVTWEELWVTVAGGGGGGRKAILQDLMGYAQPAEVLAVMGPSGSGKSTLLDALAGRLSSERRRTGKILINGRRQRLSLGYSAYVTKDDVLMTTLTVREAVCYSAGLQLPDSMTAAEKRARADETIREMGLWDAADTRIGVCAAKGLSGGQRRRVSICMEIFARPKLLFLDEPTGGLDSAASFQVMSSVARLARNEGMTVVASVQQPGTETFQLFSSLCLLASGRTVYFGPPPLASEFFAVNGFPCPLMTNPSDHYLKTINKDFDTEEQGCFHGQIMAAEAIEILAESYTCCSVRQRVMERISEIHIQGGPLVKKRSQASFFTQSMILTRRSFVNKYRDLGYYWLPFAIYTALCLCLGTIFYHIGDTYTSIQARGSVLMFMTAFLTFMAIGGFPSLVEDTKIFGREWLNGHYNASSFVVASTLSSVPFVALISVIPGAMAYYLIGLQRSWDRFAYFASVLCVCTMLVESIMMIVASIVPNILTGAVTSAGIQSIMMLTGGFFRLPDDLPAPLWRYPMFYIAFHRYANQGLFKNEFLGLSFPGYGDGETILREVWQVNLSCSKWVDLWALCGMVVLYRVVFLAIIMGVSEKIKPAVMKKMKAMSMRAAASLVDANGKPPLIR